MTVGDLCQLYLAEGVALQKPSTIRADRNRIDRHILPLIGKAKLAALTRSSIERLRDDIAQGKTKAGNAKGGKGIATRTLALLRAMLGFAVRRDIIQANPALGVRAFRQRRMDRFLSERELAALGEALKRYETEGGNKGVAGALRLLLLTGARLSEIVTCQWSHVDFDRACLRLPDSKTGAKTIYLNQPAMAQLRKLERLRRDDNPYVIVGGIHGRHLVNLQKPWRNIRQNAGLGDVRIHDLRHTFASFGAAMGHSLPVIGKILGHSQTSTTERYAHLSDNPVKDAVNGIGDRLSDALSGAARMSRPQQPIPQQVAYAFDAGFPVKAGGQWGC